jgi:hypothetical protein
LIYEAKASTSTDRIKSHLTTRNRLLQRLGPPRIARRPQYRFLSTRILTVCDNNVARLPYSGRDGTEVDATKCQQTMRRLIGIGAKQIATALQQPYLSNQAF